MAEVNKIASNDIVDKKSPEGDSYTNRNVGIFLNKYQLEQRPFGLIGYQLIGQ